MHCIAPVIPPLGRASGCMARRRSGVASPVSSIAAAQAGANALVVCNNRQAAKDVVSAVADLYRAGTGALTLESLKPDSKANVLDENGMAEARKLLGSYQLIRDDNL